MTNPRSITITICTYNRASFLEKCLAGLSCQIPDISSTPILIVNNNSNDNTAETCNKFHDKLNLSMIDEPKIGLSHARNKALEQCNTEYIVYLDDDGIPSVGWLAAIRSGLEKYDPAIFGGPFSPFYLSPKPKWFKDEFGSSHMNDPEGIVDFPYCFSGGNMGWRTSILNQVGGFDPKLGMSGKTLRLGEETALQVRLWKQPDLKRVLLRGMHMKHYVSPEKMRLSYIASRSFIYGKQLGQIDPANPLLRKTVARALLDCKFGLPLLLRLVFRDRQLYPCWGTFAARFLTLHCIGLGASMAEKSDQRLL